MAFAPDPLDIRVPPPKPQGTTGSGIVQPRSRTLDVARSYVEGLERDRQELHGLQQTYDTLVWQTIQISAYAKALHVALAQFAKDGDLPNWERIEELLAADRKTYHEVWSCECGHHKWDHDDEGHCNYLGCRRICGTT